MKKIRVAVIGATGYGGRETVKRLLKHPHAEIAVATAHHNYVGQKIADVFPELRSLTNLSCEPCDLEKIGRSCDVAMLATPNGVAMEYAPILLKAGVKVIDYSGDFRLDTLAAYESAYKLKHKSPALIKKAVYGLPELYRAKIAKANLVSNPGCFPTTIILGLAPLYSAGLVSSSPVSVSVSGTSGAGRKGLVHIIQSEVEGSIKPYKVGVHHHTPEINRILSDQSKSGKADVLFVPELGPFSRGIISTISLQLKKALDTKALLALYGKFYGHAPFVRLLPEGLYPELKAVVHTNFCDLGLYARGRQCVVFSAEDNLVKGLSGQAIQNMNLMFGFPETSGLL